MYKREQIEGAVRQVIVTHEASHSFELPLREVFVTKMADRIEEIRRHEAEQRLRERISSRTV